MVHEHDLNHLPMWRFGCYYNTSEGILEGILEGTSGSTSEESLDLVLAT